MKIVIKKDGIDSSKDIDVVTVGIVESFSDNFKMFNCPTCKTPIFQYQGRLISIFPGYAPTEIPVVVMCSNRNCGQKYLISTILSRKYFEEF